MFVSVKHCKYVLYKILLSCYLLAKKKKLIATANDVYCGSHHMAMKKTTDTSCLIPMNETTKLKPVVKLSNLNTCAYDD